MTTEGDVKKNKRKAVFLEDVRNFSYLYDKANNDYKNKTKVDGKWSDLASEHGYEGVFDEIIIFLTFNF